MIQNNTQFMAALVAAFIVLSGVVPVFGGGVGTASAEMTMDGDCEINPVTGKQVCSYEYGDITGQTTEEVWLSMHVQSEAMHDRYNRYTVETASISNLTTGMQTEEGIVTFIQAYNSNGGDTAAAKAEAFNAVNDMSSGWQASVAYEQTAQAERVRVMYETANGTEGMTPSDVFPRAGGEQEFAWGNRTLTLYNGTEINVTSFGAADTYYHNNEPTNDIVYTYYAGDVADETIVTEDGEKVGDDYHDSADGAELKQLNVRGPESVNGSTVFAMDAQRVKWTMDTINSNRKVAIDNVGAFGDSYAQRYEPGEVSAEEFMSPAYRMRTQSTDYETTGHYSYLLLAAADRGMSVDIATGFTVRFNQSGPMPEMTIDGGLYAQNGTFPGNKIETGIEYDANNLNGSAWVIDAATSKQYNLNGTFTVVEMRDIDDNVTVNSTTLQDTSFATRDADGFKEDVADWEKNYTEINKNVTYIYPEAETTGGSGLNFDGSTQRLMIVGVILLAGAAVLAGRKQQPRY